MKKMTKGAIVTGLGVALLLGGGGTLAVWNAEQSATAGNVASGDLNMEAGDGIWTSNISGEIGTSKALEGYKVVPGEKLTFSQPLKITLDGHEIAANLTVTGEDENIDFVAGTFKVGEVVLTGADGKELPGTELTESQTVTASTSFTFLVSTTDRQSTNAEYDFSEIGYYLEQVAPKAP
jgi:alternate signal-mediated exported protein